MVNLLKKDIMACFKMDFRMILKLIIGIIVFSTILMPLAPIAIPLFISYIFIIRSFQLDELNKCDYFFNSMPIDKEDIVYSKYILSTIIIIISLIFSYLFSFVIESVWYVNLLTIESILNILIILLILSSITLPIMFKYGYNKSYVFVNLITGITVVIVLILSLQPKSIGIIDSLDGGPTVLYNNLKLFITTGVCILIYLGSMYISTKIYTKKEIAN